jgi:hypothetical protein
LTGFFSGYIHVIHVIKLGGEPRFEYEEFPPYDDEGGVGGLNPTTPCLVKSPVTMFFIP